MDRRVWLNSMRWESVDESTTASHHVWRHHDLCLADPSRLAQPGQRCQNTNMAPAQRGEPLRTGQNVSKVTHFVNKCVSLPPNLVSRSLAGISAQMSGMSQKQADDASFQKSLSCPDPLTSKCLQSQFLWGREGALEPRTCHRCMIKLTRYRTFLNGAPQWHLLLQKKKSHRSTSDIRELIGESSFTIKTYQAHAWI